MRKLVKIVNILLIEYKLYCTLIYVYVQHVFIYKTMVKHNFYFVIIAILYIPATESSLSDHFLCFTENLIFLFLI